MTKNSVILTVSIPKEQSMFLDEHDLSPSELLQRTIDEQIDLFKKYHTEIGKAMQQIQKFQEELTIMHQFLEEIGKFEDFRKWRGTYVASL